MASGAHSLNFSPQTRAVGQFWGSWAGPPAGVPSYLAHACLSAVAQPKPRLQQPDPGAARRHHARPALHHARRRGQPPPPPRLPQLHLPPAAQREACLEVLSEGRLQNQPLIPRGDPGVGRRKGCLVSLLFKRLERGASRCPNKVLILWAGLCRVLPRSRCWV